VNDIKCKHTGRLVS